MCQILNKKKELINIDKTNRRALHWNLYKQQQLRKAREDMLSFQEACILLLFIDNFYYFLLHIYANVLKLNFEMM